MCKNLQYKPNPLAALCVKTREASQTDETQRAEVEKKRIGRIVEFRCWLEAPRRSMAEEWALKKPFWSVAGQPSQNCGLSHKFWSREEAVSEGLYQLCCPQSIWAELVSWLIMIIRFGVDLGACNRLSCRDRRNAGCCAPRSAAFRRMYCMSDAAPAHRLAWLWLLGEFVRYKTSDNS